MSVNSEKWIRIFTIPENTKHKKGFTIYKVVSMLYPESCPDAITKITVWKRFNDFKVLHKDLRSLHSSSKIKEKYPNFPKGSFFRRFDENVIAERLEFMLMFLDYIALYTELFTSNIVVKFFETSHTPNNMLNSSINSIRADLNLPGEPEYFPFNLTNSEDENTFSDTDSISTLSSLSLSGQNFDLMTESPHGNRLLATVDEDFALTQPNDSFSKHSLSASSVNVSFVDPILEFNCDNTRIISPSDSTAFYVFDAAEHIKKAVDFEEDSNYQQAFNEYKLGIDILLKHVKEDSNYERKEMVRFKSARYLLRAEKIYNLHLSSDMKNVQNIVKDAELPPIKTTSDLCHFKVIKVIGTGMLTLYSITQETFYIKIVQKSPMFSSHELLLPDSVPYMIQLRKFYNCENTVVLILEYTTAKKIRDFIKSNQYSLVRSNSITSDNNSESSTDGSYVDLINEYRALSMNSQTVDSRNQGNIGSGDGENVENKNCDLSMGNSIEDRDETGNTVGNRETSQGREHCDRKSSIMSFFSDLDTGKDYNISAELVTKWAAQLLLGLEKLHFLGILCRDLRIDNILIDEHHNLLLTYMCNITERKIFSNEIHIAPELRGIKKVTRSADWWSYGVILYELLVGLPLDIVHSEGFTSYTRLKIPPCVSPEGKSLLKQLLVFDGSQRHGTEDIKSHPFFSGISWKSLLTSSFKIS